MPQISNRPLSVCQISIHIHKNMTKYSMEFAVEGNGQSPLICLKAAEKMAHIHIIKASITQVATGQFPWKSPTSRIAMMQSQW